jgi:hypothetical protein
MRTGIRRTSWNWARAMAWRSLKLLRRSDQEFLWYQRLWLENLIPRLRDDGYAREASTLAYFESGLPRFARRSNDRQTELPVTPPEPQASDQSPPAQSR